MHLIELLIPLFDNAGNPFPEQLHNLMRTELTQQFGGVTAFRRAPAEGVWKHEGDVDLDQIMIIEVMNADLDRGWWSRYKARLESRFGQDEIVIRVFEFEKL